MTRHTWCLEIEIRNYMEQVFIHLPRLLYSFPRQASAGTIVCVGTKKLPHRKGSVKPVKLGRVWDTKKIAGPHLLGHTLSPPVKGN